MPGGVPRTSTFALNNATLPFVLALADKGWKQALTDDPHLRNGLNIAAGKVTCRAVAEALRYKYVSAEARAWPDDIATACRGESHEHACPKQNRMASPARRR